MFLNGQEKSNSVGLMTDHVDIYDFLKGNGIAFECHDHPAVFTCEKDLHRFMEASAHKPLILEVPSRSAESTAPIP